MYEGLKSFEENPVSQSRTQSQLQNLGKNFFLSDIARIISPPPPNSGNSHLFFGRQKTTYYVYDRKNTNGDNDGCNDTYDGNFDDNDGKKDQKTKKEIFG